jgi:hypothetical protein
LYGKEGEREKRRGGDKEDKGEISIPQCPMPNAQCPMPNFYKRLHKKTIELTK